MVIIPFLLECFIVVFSFIQVIQVSEVHTRIVMKSMPFRIENLHVIDLFLSTLIETKLLDDAKV